MGPRNVIAERIEMKPQPRLWMFATFLKEEDPGGVLPCWGAIAERFDDFVITDEDRVVLWTALLEAGNERALLLFMHLVRDHPAVLRRVLEDVDQLPVSLQRALVMFPSIEDSIGDVLDRLAPEARQVFEGGRRMISKERKVVAARLARLLVSKYFVPPRPEHAVEPLMPSDSVTSEETE